VTKVRIYELAKELGTTSKKLIEVMKKEMNLEVKNHMSSLGEDQAQRVIAILTGQVQQEEKAEESTDTTKPEQAAGPVELQKRERKQKTRGKDRKAAAKVTEGKKAHKASHKEIQAVAEKKAPRRQLKLEGRVTVGELAAHLDVSAAEVITHLLELGVVATINQELTAEAIELLADIYEVHIIFVDDPMERELLEDDDGDPDQLVTRNPVVTVLGHVDHGKTSLLDAIRHADVTAGEVGGITQHIGAYQVEVSDKKIVFLDTPGHEAFTAMRSRGAQVTDIAVLVVAADDGVMPQTVEAINHVRAAGVPIIVAVNKIDKPAANPDRVKQQLSEHGLVPEEWGGDTIFVHVSAIKGEGIDELLEMILLVAEMIEIKANPERAARGTVIEARLDRGRGPVATVLVQDGSLHVGESVICGTISGRVRAMINDKGERVKIAGPSTPVEIQGLSDVPLAGDKFQVVSDDRVARQVAEKRTLKLKEAAQKTRRVSLDDLFRQIQEGEVKELNLIVKGDVQGSVEALQDSLLKLGLDEVKIKVIHNGVGSITETDVMLASASNAIIIGFNVRPENSARKLAEQNRVDIRLYRVIYEAIEDVRAAVAGMLAPEYKEVVLGQAEVRQVFKVSRLGSIAGSYVTEGKITRNASVRIIRDGVIIHEGRLASLKRFKDDVREVLSGYECGILLENFNDIHEGDVIEAYTMQEVEDR
jgi:translation initiation factor IF-2